MKIKSQSKDKTFTLFEDEAGNVKFKIVGTASYPNLTRPDKKDDPSDKDRYSVNVIFPTDGAVHKGLEAFLKEAKKKFFPKTAAKNTLHDGAEKEGTDGYGEGVHYIGLASSIKPQLRDNEMQAITDTNDPRIYAGCKVAVLGHCWKSEFKGNRVSGGLDAVQWIGHGKRLGGGSVNPDDYFASCEAADAPVDDMGEGAASAFD